MLQTLMSLEGFLFITRWLHVLFAICWIGLLYYFNFVQGPFFAETDATTKSNAVKKLVPRALWWFRWAAMATFITGFVMLTGRGHSAGGMAALASSYWINIFTGSALGTIMFLNVWLIIWPNQKKVIAGAADAAAAGAKAALASRTNVLFSVPMLFFMLAPSHLGYAVQETSNIMLYIILAGLTILALELNAIFGKMGLLTKIAGVIHCGLALTALFCAFIAISI